MEASTKNSIILATASMNTSRCWKASDEEVRFIQDSRTAEFFVSKSIMDCVKPENSSSSLDTKKRKIQLEHEIKDDDEFSYKIVPDDEEVFVVKTLMVRKTDGTVVNLKKMQETLFKRKEYVMEDSPKYDPLYYPPSPQYAEIASYSPISMICDLTPDSFISISPPLSPLSESFFFDFEF